MFKQNKPLGISSDGLNVDIQNTSLAVTSASDLDVNVTNASVPITSASSLDVNVTNSSLPVNFAERTYLIKEHYVDYEGTVWTPPTIIPVEGFLISNGSTDRINTGFETTTNLQDLFVCFEFDYKFTNILTADTIEFTFKIKTEDGGSDVVHAISLLQTNSTYSTKMEIEGSAIETATHTSFLENIDGRGDSEINLLDTDQRHKVRFIFTPSGQYLLQAWSNKYVGWATFDTFDLSEVTNESAVPLLGNRWQVLIENDGTNATWTVGSFSVYTQQNLEIDIHKSNNPLPVSISTSDKYLIKEHYEDYKGDLWDVSDIATQVGFELYSINTSRIFIDYQEVDNMQNKFLIADLCIMFDVLQTSGSGYEIELRSRVQEDSNTTTTIYKLQQENSIFKTEMTLLGSNPIETVTHDMGDFKFDTVGPESKCRDLTVLSQKHHVRLIIAPTHQAIFQVYSPCYGQYVTVDYHDISEFTNAKNVPWLGNRWYLDATSANTNRLFVESFSVRLEDTYNLNFGGVLPKEYLNVNLKDGSTVNANGDYSITATDFKYTATKDDTRIERMIIYIEDTGIQTGRYGGSTAVTNGVKTFVSRNSVKTYLHPDLPVTSNGEWSSLCYDVSWLNFGSGNDAIIVRWTFGKSGTPIVLKTGDEIGVELNDDFTALVQHIFTIQGNH